MEQAKSNVFTCILVVTKHNVPKVFEYDLSDFRFLPEGGSQLP